MTKHDPTPASTHPATRSNQARAQAGGGGGGIPRVSMQYLAAVPLSVPAELGQA